MKRFASGIAAACLAAFCAGVAAPDALAADYPARPVQIIVPYNAGGGTDLAARVLAQTMEKYLGGTVIVRNQPGGGGSIGTSATAHAKPDGYTLGTGSQGPLVMLPQYGGIDYTINDFDFLALMGRNLMVLAAGKDAPYKNAQEFLAYAKAHPGEVTVGNSGAGGANHVATEGLGMAGDLKLKSMPFGGAVAAITATLGGHIQSVLAHPPEVATHIKAGTLVPILVLEDDRIADFPDTPTAKELGIDFTWAAWKGIVAPKGLPADVRKKLGDALDKTFHDPDFLQKMKEMGEDIDYRPGDAYKNLAMKDSTVAEKVIRAIGMYNMNAKK
jgi:tripartite-type tricarboxylate transporter receptor subunit TctC